MNHPGHIKNGFTPVIYCHTARVSCKFNKILSKIDKNSGKVLQNYPEFIKSGEAAIVELVPEKPLVVETFSTFAPLGRIVFRDRSQTIAIGIITEVTKLEKRSHIVNPNRIIKGDEYILKN